VYHIILWVVFGPKPFPRTKPRPVHTATAFAKLFYTLL